MWRQAGKSLSVAIALAATALLAVTPMRVVEAQPAAGGMPDLRAISGKPLPDRGMPPGTVTVRVARKTPANPVANVEVSALIKNAGGDVKKRTATTDASGRALFEGIGSGQQFQAEVTVDKERLQTEPFAMPAEGGVRTMLISDLGAASAGGGGTTPGGATKGAADGDFALGIVAGSAAPDATLPNKTLVVRLIDEDRKPLSNHPVLLGAVDRNNAIKVLRANSDSDGIARFSDLVTGQAAGYAAVIEHKGMRLGTDAFAMPETGGARAEIRALQRTSDPSVITIGAGARVILQMRDDTLGFLEMLPLENTSDRVFDPAPGALEIPLPKEFVAAETAQSDRKTEVRKSHGIAVQGAIMPKRALGQTDAKSAGNEITLGFVLPYEGDTREFEQSMPNGIGLVTLIMEQIPGMTIDGPGISGRESREVNGRKYWVMGAEAIGPGGTLRFAVHGLPSIDRSGHVISGTMALLLIGSAVVFGRRPRAKTRKTADDRERLIARREALFAELVAVERQRQREGSAGATGGATEKRDQLVGKLEGLYQDLAALDEQRAL
ncbi:MAG TPA: hypothetical protein VFH73_06090 [Polyangia bacterium]|nr:hypothetical protein [Polyangia bacterium]